jgi:hypothetical protein
LGKIRAVIQLTAIALFVLAIVSLVRSCQSDPTQMELFDRLAMMRSDMQAVISDGGRVASYDNNRKTTFARVYILLSIDKQTWTADLERAYRGALLARGWTQVRGETGALSFCKSGAFAVIAVSATTGNGYVDMEFDANSIAQCREALAARVASAVEE